MEENKAKSLFGTGVNKGFFLRPSRRFSAAKFTILMMTSVREAATCGVMTIKMKSIINYSNYLHCQN